MLNLNTSRDRLCKYHRSVILVSQNFYVNFLYVKLLRHCCVTAQPLYGFFLIFILLTSITVFTIT